MGEGQGTTEVGGMAGMADMGEMSETLRGFADEARQAVSRFAEEIELDRRMQENPMAVLGVAAAAGVVLGGGLWPLVRPFVKAAARAALSPTNLLAVAAALGAMRAASGGGEPASSPEEIGGGETH
jgi:hypothetical protein